jgi:hypothetical protein
LGTLKAQNCKEVMSLKKYKSYSREDIHNIYSRDTRFTPGAGKWGLHGIVSIPNTKADIVFFVTFGTTQAGHTFKEGITEDGVLTWQSKPGQKLGDPQIKRLINHDFETSNIHLLLRTNSKDKYTYLGKLSYELHNPEKEKPVQFQWQILDWGVNQELFDKIGLKLGDAELESDPFTPKLNFKQKNQLIKTDYLPIPKKQRKISEPGTKILKIDFLKIAKNSKQNGDNGELLVVDFEINKLKKFGIDKEVLHKSLEGDGHGYDIESYDEKGEKIFIEVKTTVGGLNTSFDVSINEVLVSNKKNKSYYVYRLYNYDKDMNSAEFYILNGNIEEHFNLNATQYKASYKEESNNG